MTLAPRQSTSERSNRPSCGNQTRKCEDPVRAWRGPQQGLGSFPTHAPPLRRPQEGRAAAGHLQLHGRRRRRPPTPRWQTQQPVGTCQWPRTDAVGVLLTRSAAHTSLRNAERDGKRTGACRDHRRLRSHADARVETFFCAGAQPDGRVARPRHAHAAAAAALRVSARDEHRVAGPQTRLLQPLLRQQHGLLRHLAERRSAAHHECRTKWLLDCAVT